MEITEDQNKEKCKRVTYKYLPVPRAFSITRASSKARAFFGTMTGAAPSLWDGPTRGPTHIPWFFSAEGLLGQGLCLPVTPSLQRWHVLSEQLRCPFLFSSFLFPASFPLLPPPSCLSEPPLTVTVPLKICPVWLSHTGLT